MAGDWIKMQTGLHTHPKVVRMASALKADRLRIVGGLHAAWSLFDAHSEDGCLDGYTIEALDELIGWPGFSAAMIAIEWLIPDPEGLALPRFDVHNGASAKRRAQDADRKKTVRKESASEADKKRTRIEENREDQKLSPPAGADACPHEQIIALYHELLPELRGVRIWTGKRASALRARWRESAERQDLEWWRDYFSYVKKSRFLTGKSQGRDGQPPFEADLEWLVNESNMVKVMEGKYS